MAIQNLLFGLGGLLLIAAAICWLRVAKRRDRANGRSTFSVRAIQAAAGLTAAAFIILGTGAVWHALTALSSSS
ncbi:hypothetical protein ACUXST_000071 [Sphingomonas sp. F9_3S_D5_B_2]